MSKTYTKDEVLENGYHQISVYDATSHTLLSTYKTTPDGKKDGVEKGYYVSGKVAKEIYRKDGQITTILEYNRNESLLKKELYQNGECYYKEERSHLHILEIKPFLEKHTKFGHISHKALGLNPFDKTLRIDGTEVNSNLEAYVIKVNGEYKHITIAGVIGTNYYDMEFKDGKEYNGYCNIITDRGGGGTQYTLHDGILEGDFRRVIRDGEFDYSWKDVGKIENGIYTGRLGDKFVRCRCLDFEKGTLEGPYTEFFDKVDGKKKIEGFYKNGKKEGVWKYYAKDGKVIWQKYWHEGNDCTAKYESLKKVASKRIEIEDKLSEGKDERVVLPKMTAKEKRDAIREAKKDLSR